MYDILFRIPGALSDSGLQKIAVSIDREWLTLANALRIPNRALSELAVRHPSNLKRRVFEMLKDWRDASGGTRKQLRSTLSDALIASRKQELAEQLLQENMVGSREGLDSPKLISIV